MLRGCCISQLSIPRMFTYSTYRLWIESLSLLLPLVTCQVMYDICAAAASGTEFLPPPPLAYKKWSLSEHQQVTDHTPCGAYIIFWPMWCCASTDAGYGFVSVCLCLPEVHVLSKGLDGWSWFLAWGLPSTYPTLFYKTIRVSSKARILPTGT